MMISFYFTFPRNKLQKYYSISNATAGLYDRIKEIASESLFHSFAERSTVVPFGGIEEIPACNVSNEMQKLIHDHKGDIKIRKQMPTQESMKHSASPLQ